MKRVVELCCGVQQCPAGRRVIIGGKLTAATTVGDYPGELRCEVVNVFSHDFPRLGGELAESREQLGV